MLHGNAPSDRRFSLQGDNLSQRYSAERLAPFDCSRRTMHQLLLQASQECAGWRTPSVNLGEDGELELEWWNGDKSLTISINGEDISYLAAWGIDTQHEMRDGEIGDLKQFAEQWSWLQA